MKKPMIDKKTNEMKKRKIVIVNKFASRAWSQSSSKSHRWKINSHIVSVVCVFFFALVLVVVFHIIMRVRKSQKAERFFFLYMFISINVYCEKSNTMTEQTKSFFFLVKFMENSARIHSYTFAHFMMMMKTAMKKKRESEWEKSQRIGIK